MTLAKQDRHFFLGHVGVDSGWEPFEWDEPGHGNLVAGEIVLFRSEGSGDHVLLQGLWRTHQEAPGADALSGAHNIHYSAPLGDENILVLEGATKVTNEATGEVHHFTVGDIFSISKGTPTYWEIAGPSFKKYFVIAHSD